MNDDYMEQVRQAFAEPQVRQAIDALVVAIGEAAKVLGGVVRAAADAFAAQYVSPMRDADPWYKALNWAKRQYPEWVAIMNRTKKRQRAQRRCPAACEHREHHKPDAAAVRHGTE